MKDYKKARVYATAVETVCNIIENMISDKKEDIERRKDDEFWKDEIPIMEKTVEYYEEMIDKLCAPFKIK